MEKTFSEEPSFGESSSRKAQHGSESEKAKPKKKKCGRGRKGLPGDAAATKKPKQKSAGSEWAKRNAHWVNLIRRQRADVRNAKPVIDDTAPKLNVPGIYDADVLKSTWVSLKSAFEGNQTVLKTLHMVNVLNGKTSTFEYNFSKSHTSNYAFRRETAKTIEKQNETILKMLKNPQTQMMTAKEHAEEWKRHEAMVETSSQFPLWWKLKKQEQAGMEIAPPVQCFKQHITEKSAKYPDKRPRVFLEISIKNYGVIGRMVAMLYSDYVPMTVKNFLAFCNPKAPLTYKGNLFFLIFENYYCQTGDVVENRGFGETSIYGPYFGNEDYTLKHRERGILTMYSKVPNRNASQFLITFRKLESLDGQNVAFGKIVKGFHILDAIESVGSKKTGRPREEIYISDCDEI